MPIFRGSNDDNSTPSHWFLRGRSAGAHDAQSRTLYGNRNEDESLSQNNKKVIFIVIFIVTFIYFMIAYAGEFLFEPTLKYFTIRLAPGFGLVAALVYGLPALFGIFLGEFIYLYVLHHSEITIPVLFALAANAALYVYIGIRLIQRYVEHPNYLF